MDYIRVILNTIFAIILIFLFLDFEIKQKKQYYLLWVCITIVVICDGLILYHFGYTNFMKLFPLLVYIPVFFSFLFVSKFNAIKVLFIFFTVTAIDLSISLIGLIISYFFGFDRIILNVVCYFLYLPTGILVYLYLRPSFLYMLRNTDQGWYGFCAIPLTYSALLFFTSRYNLNSVISERSIVFAGLVFVLTLAAYFLILRFFRQTREQLTLQNEQNLLKAQITASRNHLETLQESQEITFIYHHDMRHHLNLITAYLGDNNLAAAQKYIAEVENTIQDAAVETYCRNYTVNLILSSYIEKARNEQIGIETHIDLPEENIVSDMDLCVIFSNAIENAINACRLLPNPQDRTLNIVCKIKNDKPFIQITNSCCLDTIRFVNGKPASTEENHGLGTRSIAAVVQKYGGVCSFSVDEGFFKTSIIL